MQRQPLATFIDSWRNRIPLGRRLGRPRPIVAGPGLAPQSELSRPPAVEAASPVRMVPLRRSVIAVLSALLLFAALATSPNRVVGLSLRAAPEGSQVEAAGSYHSLLPDRVAGQTTASSSQKLDPLPVWVETLQSARLWSSQLSDRSVLLITLPEKCLLRVLGPMEQGRLPVYMDSSGPDGMSLGGWVNPEDVRPSDGPSRVVPTSRGGNRPTPDISTPEKFIAAVAEAAQESQLDSRVPASVTIAQAILESDWGRSLLAKKGQNYFGIKATKGPGPAGVINMNTWEVISGQNLVVSDGFKAYHTLYESVMDHGRFLADNSRYAAAFKVLNDPREFARRIHAAGYATDPAYSTKLINLMNKYNLLQYDLPLP